MNVDAVGDVWRRGEERAVVAWVHSDGRLEFDRPIRDLDRGYYCRSHREMVRLGWRRDGCVRVEGGRG